jgi:hypothetical protein
MTMLAEVEVRFRRASGNEAVCDLDRLPADDVLGGRPVRAFRWYKGRQFYSGWYWAATTAGLVAYESRLELARILLADFDPTVTGLGPDMLRRSPTNDGISDRSVTTANRRLRPAATGTASRLLRAPIGFARVPTFGIGLSPVRFRDGLASIPRVSRLGHVRPGSARSSVLGGGFLFLLVAPDDPDRERHTDRQKDPERVGLGHHGLACHRASGENHDHLQASHRTADQITKHVNERLPASRSLLVHPALAFASHVDHQTLPRGRTVLPSLVAVVAVMRRCRPGHAVASVGGQWLVT